MQLFEKKTLLIVAIIAIALPVMAQAQRKDAYKFLPRGAQIEQTVNLTGFGLFHQEVVALSYEMQLWPEAVQSHCGVLVLERVNSKSWIPIYQEAVTEGSPTEVRIEAIKTLTEISGKPARVALLVFERWGGAGVSGGWHIVVFNEDKNDIVRISRDKVLLEKLEQMGYENPCVGPCYIYRYNELTVKNEIIVEEIPGESYYNRPTLQVSYAFDGNSVKIVNVKELK
jgi:hypothetical protein